MDVSFDFQCYHLVILLVLYVLALGIMSDNKPTKTYPPSAYEVEKWRVGNMSMSEKRELAVQYFPELFREDGPTLLEAVRFATDSLCFGWSYNIHPTSIAACEVAKAHLGKFSLKPLVPVEVKMD